MTNIKGKCFQEETLKKVLFNLNVNFWTFVLLKVLSTSLYSEKICAGQTKFLFLNGYIKSFDEFLSNPKTNYVIVNQTECKVAEQPFMQNV